MGEFSGRVTDQADISASRAEVWRALTDPDLLASITPLLSSIEADGDTWTWNMATIKALGVSIAPSFTEAMHFEEPGLIRYDHRPPDGHRERAGAQGRYELTEIDGGTHLDIDLTVTVELPLPSAASKAVEKVMRSTMERTGAKFATNLMDHLGAHPL